MTPSRLFRYRFVFGAICAGAMFVESTSGAERAKRGAKEKMPENSAPVLMSKTGGGSTFADVNELRAAAEQGNPKAEAQFGEMLLNGDAANGVKKDQPRAIAMLEKAARAGEASAAFRVGMLLDDGVGVAQDRARALAYFKAAAAGGVAEAFHNIGAAYASARGVRPDFTEALAWLTLAGRRGADRSAEQTVRDRLQKSGRASTLAAAEKRAVEIERELATKSVAEWLPAEEAVAAGKAESTKSSPR